MKQIIFLWLINVVQSSFIFPQENSILYVNSSYNITCNSKLDNLYLLHKDNITNSERISLYNNNLISL